MVNLLAPVVTARTPTDVQVADFPGLYRYSRSGLYYTCKKLGGVRRQRSLGTCDRKIKMKEWLGSLDKVEKTITATDFVFRDPRKSLARAR